MKNKASLLLPLLILVVLVGLFFFLRKQDVQEIQSEEQLTAFAIKDTALVDQVIIWEPNGAKMIISRRNKDSIWMLNDGKYEARKDAIQLILETAYRIRVKQRISKTAHPEILKQLAVAKKEVNFFRNGEDEPFKTYYVGSSTPDKLGTYMLLRHGNEDISDNEPYIVYKPGMYGNLESRFFGDLNDWRSPTVFSYARNNLKRVSLQHFETPALSFAMEALANGDVKLFDHANNQITHFDKAAAQRYLNAFSQLNYEGFNQSLTAMEADSVRNATPFYVMEVTDQNDQTKRLIIHRTKAPSDVYDHKGDRILWDQDRVWGHFDGSTDLMRLQYFSWGKQFKPITFFTE